MAEKIKFTDEESETFKEGLYDMKENFEDMIKKLEGPVPLDADPDVNAFFVQALKNIKASLLMTSAFIDEPNAVFDFSNGGILKTFVIVYETHLDKSAKMNKNKTVLAKLKAMVDSFGIDFKK